MSWATDESVWCCKEGKIFRSNLMNIGQIKDFYKLNELNAKDIQIIYKLVIEPTNPILQKLNNNWVSSFNLIFLLKRIIEQKGLSNKNLNMLIDEEIHNAEENLHEKVENSAIGYIESILNENISFYKTDIGRVEFTHFLCIQYMRTNKMKSNVLSAFSQRRYIKLIDIDKCWNVLSHILATNLAYSIYADKSFNIFLLKNRYQKELITGDQPVINTYARKITNAGTPNKIEFYYPVSPKLAILITESADNNCSDVIILKEDEVNNYNLMMIKESH